MPAPIPVTFGEHPWLDLANSRWRDHTGSGAVNDRLPMVEWRTWFLRRWGFELDQPEPAPVDDLSATRDAIRAVAAAWAHCRQAPTAARATLDDALRRSPLNRRLGAQGPRLLVETVPARRDWSWVLAAVVTSLAEADPDLVKECGNPDCSWLFYDTSRNRTRRWCDASICGNLVKVRQFRSRARRRA